MPSSRPKVQLPSYKQPLRDHCSVLRFHTFQLPVQGLQTYQKSDRSIVHRLRYQRRPARRRIKFRCHPAGSEYHLQVHWSRLPTEKHHPESEKRHRSAVQHRLIRFCYYRSVSAYRQPMSWRRFAAAQCRLLNLEQMRSAYPDRLTVLLHRYLKRRNLPAIVPDRFAAVQHRWYKRKYRRKDCRRRIAIVRYRCRLQKHPEAIRCPLRTVPVPCRCSSC